jgi:methylmalonyl-CoA carboxyltransferase large subunit
MGEFAMKINAKNINPEIVAAISAAVQMMVGKKVVAVRIQRSDAWAMAGRRSIV